MLDEKEKALISRLLSRDPSAVREFYDAYTPLLLRFIRKKIDNEADVEEIAQDTLFALLDGIRDFTGRCKLSTYMCSIASNKIVDFYRKKRIKRIVFSQLPDGFESLISEALGPEDVLTTRFVQEKITAVFQSMSPHYRQVLSMKYVEGRSVDEIAEKMQLSFKSVESILFRARKTFVKLYTSG